MSSHGPSVRVSSNVIVTPPGQLSVAVGVASVGTASHSTVISAGMPAKTGGVISNTKMLCVCVSVLPQLSVAVQVRFKVYSFSQLPSIRVSANVISTSVSQLSVAVGEAAVGISSHSTDISAGISAKIGSVVS